ncbi:MAG TPA: peroxiredoxin [Pirellulaceae bacterium]|nr:peroxiredoxin [Pirellulaceae bacterium]
MPKVENRSMAEIQSSPANRCGFWLTLSRMTAIQTGDRAPDFTSEAHDGRQVSLADYRGQVVVLFFYPSDGTPVCTAEACAFRDAYADFTQAGAVVMGVSADSPESHRKFIADHRLPFVLLSDPVGALRKLFGVPRTLGIFPGRVTYVIDKQGVVRLVFNSQLAAARHVTETLQAVHQLAAESA